MQKAGFLVVLVIVVITALADDRPYQFAFNLGTQHREEQKDADGTVKGQYGFATADGYYQTVVYATDAEGHFRILNRTRIRIAPPPPVKGTRLDEAGRQARNLLTSSTTTSTTTTTTERVAVYQFNYTARADTGLTEHGRNETGFSDSSKVGDYFWDGPDGYRRIVTYTADDKGGYRPTLRQIKLPIK